MKITFRFKQTQFYYVRYLIPPLLGATGVKNIYERTAIIFAEQVALIFLPCLRQPAQIFLIYPLKGIFLRKMYESVF